MSFRKILYWSHLICGVVAGLVILTMSVTGVILTYERQIKANAVSELNAEPPAGAVVLPMAKLTELAMAEIQKQENKSVEPRSIKVMNDLTAPVLFNFRPGGNIYLNKYTGEYLGKGPEELVGFFRNMMTFHRWFSLTGEDRNTGRMITNTANLMFLFILVSGIYLWLPKVMKWANFKKVLFFRKTTSSRARDFNWHHVMGIWAVLPTIVVVATGTVFYYKWANDLVYTMMGDEPPVRGRAAPSGDKPSVPTGESKTLDVLMETASLKEAEWKSVTMTYPKADALDVRFSVDKGNGGEPTKRGTLTLDRYSGAEKTWVPFEGNSAGRQARLYVRYLHTGEALGIVGQTIAGIVSFLMIIMVWTGIALAYRKYIPPLFSKK